MISPSFDISQQEEYGGWDVVLCCKEWVLVLWKRACGFSYLLRLFLSKPVSSQLFTPTYITSSAGHPCLLHIILHTNFIHTIHTTIYFKLQSSEFSTEFHFTTTWKSTWQAQLVKSFAAKVSYLPPCSLFSFCLFVILLHFLFSSTWCWSCNILVFF